MLELYDFHLREMLLKVKSLPAESKTIVTACLLTPPDRIVYATSNLREDGTWNHAERNAVKEYFNSYGLPPQDSVLITSLSPCKKDSKHRYGVSCTDLIIGNDPDFNGLFIPNIHVGFFDPWQLTIEEYQALGLNLTVSQDPKICNVCRRLFDYFKGETKGLSKAKFIDDVLNEL